MELVIAVLLLGPLATKIINDRNVGSALTLAITNVVALVVWAVIFSALHKFIDYGLTMIVGWLCLLLMQAVFFWWAMEGTKWKRSMEAFVRARLKAGKAT